MEGLIRMPRLTRRKQKGGYTTDTRPRVNGAQPIRNRTIVDIPQRKEFIIKQHRSGTIFERQNVEPLIERLVRLEGVESVYLYEDNSEIQVEFDGLDQNVYVDADVRYRPGNQQIEIYGRNPNTRELIAKEVEEFLKDAENLRPGHGGGRRRTRTRTRKNRKAK